MVQALAPAPQHKCSGLGHPQPATQTPCTSLRPFLCHVTSGLLYNMQQQLGLGAATADAMVRWCCQALCNIHRATSRSTETPTASRFYRCNVHLRRTAKGTAELHCHTSDMVQTRVCLVSALAAQVWLSAMLDRLRCCRYPEESCKSAYKTHKLQGHPGLY